MTRSELPGSGSLDSPEVMDLRMTLPAVPAFIALRHLVDTTVSRGWPVWSWLRAILPVEKTVEFGLSIVAACSIGRLASAHACIRELGRSI